MQNATPTITTAQRHFRTVGKNYKEKNDNLLQAGK